MQVRRNHNGKRFDTKTQMQGKKGPQIRIIGGCYIQ